MYTLSDFIIDFGTIAFAASGTLAAIRKKLDIFGVLIIAFATSIGGGTIRDIFLGHLPLKWLQSPKLMFIILGASIITILLKNHIEKLDKSLLFFDSLGLGFFTILGIKAAIATNLSPYAAIIIGTITAAFGGVIRDIFLNEIPSLFRKEIYATACILGGILYFILAKFSIPIQLLDTFVIIFIFSFRIASLKYKFSLPTF